MKLFATLLLFFYSGLSLPATESGTIFQDWVVNCEDNAKTQKSQCFLVQTVSNKVSSQPIARAMVGYTETKKSPSAIFLVANLLDPASKLKLVFSKDFAVSFKLSKCNQQSKSCLAVLELDKPLLDAFNAGQIVYLVFNFANEERTVPFSLMGFKAGLKSLSN